MSVAILARLEASLIFINTLKLSPGFTSKVEAARYKTSPSADASEEQQIAFKIRHKRIKKILILVFIFFI